MSALTPAHCKHHTPHWPSSVSGAGDLEAKATSPTAAWEGRAIWEGQFAERLWDTFRSNKHDVKNLNLPAGKPCSIVGSLLDRKGLQFKGCWTKTKQSLLPLHRRARASVAVAPSAFHRQVVGVGVDWPIWNVTDTTRKEGTFHLLSQRGVRCKLQEAPPPEPQTRALACRPGP